MLKQFKQDYFTRRLIQVWIGCGRNPTRTADKLLPPLGSKGKGRMWKTSGFHQGMQPACYDLREGYPQILSVSCFSPNSGQDSALGQINQKAREYKSPVDVVRQVSFLDRSLWNKLESDSRRNEISTIVIQTDHSMCLFCYIATYNYTDTKHTYTFTLFSK